MIFFKPSIEFKIKGYEKTLSQLLTKLNNDNGFVKDCTIEHFKLQYFNTEYVEAKFKNVYTLSQHAITHQLNSLSAYWEKIKDRFFKSLEKELDIRWMGQLKTVCYLDCLPLPCVDIFNKTLSLSYTQNLDENAKYLITTIVKSLLVYYYVGREAKHNSIEYSKDNLYWIMADLVADSLFYNSSLKEFACNTAYKYYYNLKIAGKNVIAQFRQMYNNLNFTTFMQYVLDYIKDYRDIFTKFTNRY